MRSTKTAICSTAVASFILVAATACATGPTAEKDSAPDVVMHASLAEDYATVEELTRASELVVQATAKDSTEVDVHGVPFTVTTFAVDDVLHGSLPDHLISVRYTGSETVVVDNLPRVPREGVHYVLYLQPFSIDSKTTDEWIVVGQGQWRSDGRDRAYTLDILSASESELPVVLEPGASN